MSWSQTIASITRWALAGAVVGLLVGLALLAADVVDNPFWLSSIGIVVGAGLSPTRSAQRPPAGD